jgi:hypothetical protein
MTHNAATAGPWTLRPTTDINWALLIVSGDIATGMSDVAAIARGQEKVAPLLLAAPALRDALYPDELEAVANEIDCFEHSARAASLRYIAKQGRRALAAADGDVAGGG